MGRKSSRKKKFEESETNPDAVGDLLQDEGMGTVGYRVADLDAPVERARVKDNGVGAGEGKASLVEPVVFQVVIKIVGGCRPALLLQAQGDEDVGVAGRLVASEPLGPWVIVRLQSVKERTGCEANIPNAEEGEERQGGTGNPRMGEVSKDGDADVGETRTVVEDGEKIEESLRRVRSVGLPGADDTQVPAGARQKGTGGTRYAVAEHGKAVADRFECGTGIGERFAFDQRRRGGVKVGGTHAHQSGGPLEGKPGPRAGLGKDVNESRGGVRWAGGGPGTESTGAGEDCLQAGWGPVLDGDEMIDGCGRIHGAGP